MMQPAALVLAGTRPGGDPFAKEQGVAHKALIEIDGISLVERVVSALRGAGVERIAVSCDDGEVAALARSFGAETIATGIGPSASVAAGFAYLGAPMIVTTSDHALLKAAWIRQLVQDTPANADLSVMLAKRERIESELPGSKRTYLRFADGQWSGCNLFYLQTSEAARALDVWAMVEADRKRPWRIAARLGLTTLFSMLVGKLSLAEGLARLGERIGVSASLVEAKSGLAAVDVDKAQDLQSVREILASTDEK